MEHQATTEFREAQQIRSSEDSRFQTQDSDNKLHSRHAFDFVSAEELYSLLVKERSSHVIVLEVHLPFDGEEGGPGTIGRADVENSYAADVVAREILISAAQARLDNDFQASLDSHDSLNSFLPTLPNALRVHPSFFEHGSPAAIEGRFGSKQTHPKYYPNYSHPNDGNVAGNYSRKRDISAEGSEDKHKRQKIVDCVSTAITNNHSTKFPSGVESLRHLLATELGVQQDSTIVIYGRGQVPMMTSCRAAWALLSAGVTGMVHILDGGFPVWAKLAYEKKLEQETQNSSSSVPSEQFNFFSIPPVPPLQHAAKVASFVGHKVAQTFEQIGGLSHDSSSNGFRFLAILEEVQSAVAESEKHEKEAKPNSTLKDIPKLVDIRKYSEHAGSDENNYGFFPSAGHIPTSVWQGNWDELVDYGVIKGKAAHEHISHSESSKILASADEAYKLLASRPLGTLKWTDTRERWETLGLIGSPALEESRSVDAQKIKRPLIFYCGTGWRSAVSTLMALRMGIPAANYDGGFYEWQHGGGKVCKS